MIKEKPKNRYALYNMRYERVLATGKVSHTYLGVRIQTSRGIMRFSRVICFDAKNARQLGESIANAAKTPTYVLKYRQGKRRSFALSTKVIEPQAQIPSDSSL